MQSILNVGDWFLLFANLTSKQRMISGTFALRPVINPNLLFSYCPNPLLYYLFDSLPLFFFLFYFYISLFMFGLWTKRMYAFTPIFLLSFSLVWTCCCVNRVVGCKNKIHFKFLSSVKWLLGFCEKELNIYGNGINYILPSLVYFFEKHSWWEN